MECMIKKLSLGVQNGARRGGKGAKGTSGYQVEIRPYEKNAKEHTESQLKQLADIVREVGWRQPVIVTQGGVIVAGHGRWMAYQAHKESHGLKEIWVMDSLS